MPSPTALLRKFFRWLDCLAFANAGNFGDFDRLLRRQADAATPPAPAARPTDAADPGFARWLAVWNGAAASGSVQGKVDENA